MWEEFTNLNFVEGSTADNSDIVISWGAGDHGDDHPFDGFGGVLAHAYQPPSNGTSHNLTGDIHFDEDETWTTATSANPKDLVRMAAHEIGHALGLRHTTIQGTLMWPNFLNTHRYLCLDDIQGIQDIYGAVTNYTAIQGDDTICGSGNVVYTIEGVCGFAGINWTSSSNIQIVSHAAESITIKKIGSGTSGWIQANIQSVLVRKNITLSTTVDVILDTVQFEGSAFYVSAHAVGGSAPYQWYVNGQLTQLLVILHSAIVIHAQQAVLMWVLLPIRGFRSDQAYYYEDCGSGGHRMTIYPNPASSEINIVSAEGDLGASFSSSSMEIVPQTQDMTLTLLDFTGNPVKEVVHQGLLKDLKMDVSVFSKGIYFLRIVGKEVEETHTVVLE